MKVDAYDLNSNLIWTYKTDTVDNVEYVYNLNWYNTNRAYVLMNSKICVLDVLNGKVINTYNIPKEEKHKAKKLNKY